MKSIFKESSIMTVASFVFAFLVAIIIIATSVYKNSQKTDDLIAHANAQAVKLSDISEENSPQVINYTGEMADDITIVDRNYDEIESHPQVTTTYVYPQGKPQGWRRSLVIACRKCRLAKPLKKASTHDNWGTWQKEPSNRVAVEAVTVGNIGTVTQPIPMYEDNNTHGSYQYVAPVHVDTNMVTFHATAEAPQGTIYKLSDKGEGTVIQGVYFNQLASPGNETYIQEVNIDGQTALLPSQKLTPGKTRVTTKDGVCKLKSTKDVRLVTQKTAKEVYARYHVAPGSGVCKWRHYTTKKGKPAREGCEVDHLISLEIGGANDIENLWPQPYTQHPGAHEKDKLENWLHKQICTGKMSVKEVQSGIASDWVQMYEKMHKAQAAQ